MSGSTSGDASYALCWTVHTRMKYLLWIEGKETGPYEQREVEAAVADGTIYSDTLARRETGISWDPIEVLLPSVKDVVPVRRKGDSETVTETVERAPRAPAKSMSRGHGVFLTLLLLGVLGLLVWDHVKPMARWEYRTVVIPTVSPETSESEAKDGRPDEAALAELGGEGWELAGSYSATEAPKLGEGDVTVDAIATDASKQVVLLFKRAERNPLVVRYIDPLWNRGAKPVVKSGNPPEVEPGMKTVAKSEGEAQSEPEPATEPETVPEVKEPLPVR